MAMDKTTTRRMIGAIVLVLVAALVLAYLLKSKNDTPEVEKVHDVTLPSSPILKFPGDGTANDSATAAQDADQKVGLGVRPDGLKPAGDAVSDAASQAQQSATNGLKTVGGSSASQGSSTQGAADNKQDTKVVTKPTSDKKPGSRLKEADVLTLDNASKVSSGKDKSNDDKDQKKSSRDKAELVGEKKLPKHSDKARRDADRKAAQAKKDAAKKAAAKKAEAKKKAASSDAIPSTGFSVQLLATGSESKAKSVKKQMVAEGYPAYLMSVIKNGKTLYRVRVGSYQDHAEASNVQARMKRRYTQNSNVQNSLVVEN